LRHAVNSGVGQAIIDANAFKIVISKSKRTDAKQLQPNEKTDEIPSIGTLMQNKPPLVRQRCLTTTATAASSALP